MQTICKHLLALGLLLSSAVALGQTFEQGGITYNTRPDGSAEVTLGEGFYRGAIEIPATAGGKTVAALGHGAMNGSHGLRTLVLPATLTALGDYALNGCDSLTAVNLPAGLTRIGDHALARCELLKGTLAVPEGVAEIGDFAFFRCRTLQGITLPASVTDIGTRAFMGCNQLRAITVAEGNAAFADDAGVLLSADRKNLLAFPRKQTNWRDYVVPATVEHIAEYAFYGCDAMKTITFPSRLTTIGISAMENCRLIGSVTLPPTITAIGANAFKGCDGLKDIHCQTGTPPALNPFRTPFGYLTDLSAKTLYVPIGSATAYAAAPVWADFGTIVEEEGSSVGNLAVAPVRVAVEDRTITVMGTDSHSEISLIGIDGRVLARGTNAFTVDNAGVYIIRVNSRTFKVLIK